MSRLLSVQDYDRYGGTGQPRVSTSPPLLAQTPDYGAMWYGLWDPC